MQINIEGIIVVETAYGETSKIINILTKEKGIIGVMCKGAKSMKSKLRALTITFTHANFYLQYKENGLSILKDVDIIDDYKNIRQDILLMAYTNYLIELSVQVVKQSYENNIYDLLISALKKIENGLNPLVISNIIETKYLNYLGVAINLNECVLCSTKKNIITLDGSIGGLVCTNCYTNEKIVDLKTIKLLRMYYLVDINSLSKIDIKESEVLEVNYFLNQYYDKYTGLYLKSKKFINELNKI